MSLRLPSLLDAPIGFAHRGARAHAPENTAESFDLAVKLGATGIESDVWITADGELVLDHDGVVGLRRRPIHTVDRRDLPESLLTLPELHARIPAGLYLSIDIKHEEAMAPVLEWTTTLSLAQRRSLFLCYPDWIRLAEWRSLDAEVRLIDSTSLHRMERGPELRAHQLAEAGIDGVNLRYDEWTGGMTTLFHRFGRICFGWDAQHDRILRELLRIGIDGVFSDHVDRMVDALADHEPAPGSGRNGFGS